MFFVVLNSRTDQYYNQTSPGPLWVDHLVCATFFDYETQANEIVDLQKSVGTLITLRETEDLSAARVDVAVDTLTEL